MKVAEKAGCPVWELEDAPSWWVERLAIALAAETAAANERQLREQRRQQRSQTSRRP